MEKIKTGRFKMRRTWLAGVAALALAGCQAIAEERLQSGAEVQTEMATPGGEADPALWTLDWQTPQPHERGPGFDPNNILEDFVFGAVYFRSSNPPAEDWEQDYATACEDGHNVFRHWLIWNSVEVAPGIYDWSAYDAQLDLAATCGIKVILGEMVTSAPEWAFETWPEARLEARDGTADRSSMGSASVTGGYPGLSLNHPEVRAAAGAFLTAAAERYGDHPAMGGWDLVNEMKFPQSPNEGQEDYDFSPATQAKFRTWLKEKYGSLDGVGQAWGRYSFTSWNQVAAPRDMGPFPEVLDWLDFRVDDFHEQVAWRANILRAAAPDIPITAHAKAYALNRLARGANNAFEGTKITDLYGFTWDAPGKGLAAWYQMQAVDMIRAAARGQDFWHAEATGGPRWPSRRARDDGRVATPGDIRMQALLSYAGGTQGTLNPRWRPLLNGPLWGAYGYYGLDGSRTDRSAMASRLAKWGRAMQAKQDLWAADPVPGDIGILVVPETQLYLWAFGNRGFDEHVYPESIWGAYRAFFDAGIQADFVHIEDLAGYEGVVYLPVPMMLKAESSAAIIDWVDAGGTLISEGAPGYLTDLGWAGETQPAQGFADLFGVRESYVEFGANIHEGMEFTTPDRTALPVGFAHQQYAPDGGEAVGTHASGAAAIVDNTPGDGRTRLIGAFPGWAYFQDQTPALRDFFVQQLEWAGVEPSVRFLSGPSDKVMVRMHKAGDRHILWIVNHDRGEDHSIRIELAARYGRFTGAERLWGETQPMVDDRIIEVTVPERDGLVLKLQR